MQCSRAHTSFNICATCCSLSLFRRNIQLFSCCPFISLFYRWCFILKPQESLHHFCPNSPWGKCEDADENADGELRAGPGIPLKCLARWGTRLPGRRRPGKMNHATIFSFPSTTVTFFYYHIFFLSLLELCVVCSMESYISVTICKNRYLSIIVIYQKKLCDAH